MTAPKVRLIATARQNYGGRLVRVRQPFEVNTEAEARELITLGVAQRAPVDDPEAQPSRRTYRRRDMQAEGDG